jgi:hypothetical protein
VNQSLPWLKGESRMTNQKKLTLVNDAPSDDGARVEREPTAQAKGKK